MRVPARRSILELSSLADNKTGCTWGEVVVVISNGEWYSAVEINTVIGGISLWGNVGSPLFTAK